MAASTTRPILTLRNISKSFGSTRALVSAQFELYPAEITALIDEQGGGKSTLVKILTGVYPRDSGQICLEGVPIKINSRAEAQKLGISVIHQDSLVLDDVSVAENIFVASRPPRYRLVGWPEMRRRAAAILRQLDSDIDPATPMRDLSLAQKLVVHVARTLCHESRIVIIDEPTSALSQTEADELLGILARLRDGGHAILYISHKIEEISAIADRYVVYRDGVTVGSGLMAKTSKDQLMRLMVGRSIDQLLPARSTQVGPAAVTVEGLRRKDESADITLTIRQGEILGVYGLVGAGRSDVMEALFGVGSTDAACALPDGNEVGIRTISEPLHLKIAYVPEHGQRRAVLPLAVQKNMGLVSLHALSRHGFASKSRARVTAQRWMETLQIRISGDTQGAGELAGENQQKVALAKWLRTLPKVLILDEPTKGIDVGSKAAVYKIISELAQQGLAIVLISSDLPEVLGIADRGSRDAARQNQNLFRAHGGHLESPGARCNRWLVWEPLEPPGQGHVCALV